MDQMQVPCLLKKKWDLRERQRPNRPPRRRSRRTENLTQRRKGRGKNRISRNRRRQGYVGQERWQRKQKGVHSMSPFLCVLCALLRLSLVSAIAIRSVYELG